MRRLLGTILLLAAGTASANSGTSDIIGGTSTTVGEHPSVVVITIGGALCSGTLINAEWVVTAAHCVSPAVIGLSQTEITQRTTVFFNTVDLTQSQGTPIKAKETIPRLPNWSEANIGANDIGLIHLATPITSIQPTKVNLDPAKAPVGINVLMVGYGATGAGATGSVGVEFELANRVSIGCSAIGVSDANLLCFSQSDAKGKCEGDSGGPSFATIDGVETLVGVTSFGDQDCTQFGADTRTDAEKQFLLDHIPQLEGCTTATECGDGNICLQGQCISEPFSDGGLGDTCAAPADCDDGQCASGPDGMRCTVTCSPAIAGSCPDGFDCLDAGGQGACWPADGGGCCDASGRGGPTALLGIVVVGLVLRRRRR